MAVMRSPVVSRYGVVRETESEWRLRYMCKSISISEKASMDQAVQVRERKQR